MTNGGVSVPTGAASVPGGEDAGGKDSGDGPGVVVSATLPSETAVAGARLITVVVGNAADGTVVDGSSLGTGCESSLAHAAVARSVAIIARRRVRGSNP